MAKNPNISDLDAGQAFKRAMDGDHDAIRIVNAVDTEIEISLDDSDSIQSVARTRVLEGEADCCDLRRVCMYGDGTVEVFNGVEWVDYPIDNLEVKALCAFKIRGSNCVLVGQS